MSAPEAVLRLLGLAARAGRVIPGTERVREAARAGTLGFAVVAADASANSRDKLVPLLEARGIAFAVAFSRTELGGAVGRAPLSAVGLTDTSFVGRIRELIPGPAGRSG